MLKIIADIVSSIPNIPQINEPIDAPIIIPPIGIKYIIAAPLRIKPELRLISTKSPSLASTLFSVSVIFLESERKE